jgi:hypothetical protein
MRFFQIHEHAEGAGGEEAVGGVGKPIILLTRPCDACGHYIGGGYKKWDIASAPKGFCSFLSVGLLRFSLS